MNAKMKKMLLICAILFGAMAYGQTSKGNWFADADFGLSYEKESMEGNETLSRFKVSPSLNYFVIENLAVGAGLSYEKISPKEGVSTTSFGLIPNATFFIPLDSALRPFVRGNVGYISETPSDRSGLTYGGRVGIAYLLNGGAAVTASVGYNVKKLSVKDSKATTFSKLDAGIGVALFF